MRMIAANISNEDVKEAEEVEASAAISTSEFIYIPLINGKKNSRICTRKNLAVYLVNNLTCKTLDFLKHFKNLLFKIRNFNIFNFLILPKKKKAPIKEP